MRPSDMLNSHTFSVNSVVISARRGSCFQLTRPCPTSLDLDNFLVASQGHSLISTPSSTTSRKPAAHCCRPATQDASVCYSANDLRLEWGYRSPGIFTRQAYEAPALQAGAETPLTGCHLGEKALLPVMI